MRWYLLKTWPGKEEQLIEKIQRTVSPDLYGECFVISQQRIWRKQQKNVVHVEKLFPGCVFFTCKNTDYVFERLKSAPSIAGMIMCGELAILPMRKADADFLLRISGEDHMVKLSSVRKGENGQLCEISGPLKVCSGQIERYQLKKRYAVIRHNLWGKNLGIVMGIALKEDMDLRSYFE